MEMIFFVVLPFLLAGCIAYLVCAAIPPLRRFILSASIWCLACLPPSLEITASFILWSVGLQVFNNLLFDTSLDFHLHQAKLLNYLLTSAAVLVVISAATAATLLHGIIIRRMTMALFRVYLAAVSTGVGILTGAFLCFCFGPKFNLLTYPIPALLLTFALASSLAYVSYANATLFRGDHPSFLPIVTEHEFNHAD